ncbi:MAG: 50S ribosomal protein L2 [Candidatus Woesearchaeota archaeon]
MGKRITAQKRGRGSLRYQVHSFRYKGKAKTLRGRDSALVTDLVSCKGHSAPLAQVCYDDGTAGFTIAPEGLCVGDVIDMSSQAKLDHGNVLKLDDIPEGVSVFNLESVPGDGGKFVRSSGNYAKVVSKSKAGVVVEFPSRRQRSFNPDCRATIGAVAGGGRVEKPFLKAGNKYKAMKARNKYWPRVSANSMNAVDHPFGNSRSSFKAKSRPAPRNAPPGRRVGAIRPRKTGRSRSRRV